MRLRKAVIVSSNPFRPAEGTETQLDGALSRLPQRVPIHFDPQRVLKLKLRSRRAARRISSNPFRPAEGTETCYLPKWFARIVDVPIHFDPQRVLKRYRRA